MMPVDFCGEACQHMHMSANLLGDAGALAVAIINVVKTVVAIVAKN